MILAKFLIVPILPSIGVEGVIMIAPDIRRPLGTSR
jgi:hypothetical protein